MLWQIWRGEMTKPTGRFLIEISHSNGGILNLGSFHIETNRFKYTVF